MKTSIKQILTRELVGKEVLIHKYGTEAWGFSYSCTRIEEEPYLGCDYAKILACELDFDLIQSITIMIDVIPTETIDTRWVEVRVDSILELRES